jgi:hypothetical protein
VIERTSSGGGAPVGRLLAGSPFAGAHASRPLGLRPNIAGLPMASAYDFDEWGDLVQCILCVAADFPQELRQPALMAALIINSKASGVTKKELLLLAAKAYDQIEQHRPQ